MIKAAAIYGAGGHSRVIASILKRQDIAIYGIFDDSYRGSENIQEIPVRGTYLDILKYKQSISSVYLALGDNILRRKAYEFLSRNQFTLPALIHPNAFLEMDSQIGSAAVICTGALLGTETHIGRGVLMNTGCSVDHESRIGDFVHIAPKAVVAGRSIIGANTFVGMNACIADHIVVGENARIGAGAIILKDVPDNTKITGVYH